MKLFVDTWGWLVLADLKDPLHSKTAECYKELSGKEGRVLTSNFVLAETMTLLFRRRPYSEALRFSMGILKSPFIRVETVTDPRFRKAFELRQRFSDKPKISFTDLSSMALMMELKLTDILTADAHFTQVGLGFHTMPN